MGLPLDALKKYLRELSIQDLLILYGYISAILEEKWEEIDFHQLEESELNDEIVELVKMSQSIPLEQHLNLSKEFSSKDNEN